MPTMISETKLTNGTKIFCLRELEVPVLYEQIQDYIKYEIKIDEGDIVFDVGANIGLFSLWTYQNCRQNVNIFAFEPIPAIFEVLQANAERFDPQKIKVFPYGLGKESKSVKFAYHRNATMLSTAYQDDLPELQNQLKQTAVRNIKNAPKSVRWLRWLPPCLRSLLIQSKLNEAFQIEQVICQLRTISEIVREHKIKRIDLLKIDVEKAELDVLMGIKDRDWQKIKQVAIEVHDLDGRLQEITNLLEQHGFNEIKVAQEAMLEGSNLFNLYAWRV